MDGPEFVGANRTTLIDGLTNDVDDATEGLGTDGHANGITSVIHGLATHKTLSGVEGNGAHVVATQVLGGLKDETVSSALNLKSVENRRKRTFKFDIDDGTNNLGDLSSGGEASYSKSMRSVTSLWEGQKVILTLASESGQHM